MTDTSRLERAFLAIAAAVRSDGWRPVARTRGAVPRMRTVILQRDESKNGWCVTFRRVCNDGSIDSRLCYRYDDETSDLDLLVAETIEHLRSRSIESGDPLLFTPADMIRTRQETERAWKDGRDHGVEDARRSNEERTRCADYTREVLLVTRCGSSRVLAAEHGFPTSHIIVPTTDGGRRDFYLDVANARDDQGRKIYREVGDPLSQVGFDDGAERDESPLTCPHPMYRKSEDGKSCRDCGTSLAKETTTTTLADLTRNMVYLFDGFEYVDVDREDVCLDGEPCPRCGVSS